MLLPCTFRMIKDIIVRDVPKYTGGKVTVRGEVAYHPYRWDQITPPKD